MFLSWLRSCNSEKIEGRCCRVAEKAGRCGGGWREREKGRGRGLSSRKDIAAVSSERRVKEEEDVLWWEEMGEQVVCRLFARRDRIKAFSGRDAEREA